MIDHFSLFCFKKKVFKSITTLFIFLVLGRIALFITHLMVKTSIFGKKEEKIFSSFSYFGEK
jgi:hypothetical protein